MDRENQNILYSSTNTLPKNTLLYITIFLITIASNSCNFIAFHNDADINYKKEMREFVQEISSYSKSINSNFIIIPQNGVELVTEDGNEIGNIDEKYVTAIDGIGQEDLYYGYDNDDQLTLATITQNIISFLDLVKANQIKILVTDYCSTNSYVDKSYHKNDINGYISFAADHRELDNIPNYPDPIYNENDDIISNLVDVDNFLYLINPSGFTSKQNFIDAVTATNYDLIIMDFFFNDEEFTESELNEFRNKANGGKRLIISYMSIGEAEDYRYYWQYDWSSNPPKWLEREDQNWEGNYKVKYWNQDWKDIIYGSADSYLNKIIDKGFDGVYLDIIDAFEYFENQ